MSNPDPGTELSLEHLLLGERWSMTRRALLFSAGSFSVVAVANGLALTFSAPPGESSLGDVWWGVMDLLFGFSGVGLMIDVVGLGVFLIAGLALIHAYLNQGYLPSLVLAAAPYYAFYVFTVDGPAYGLVVAVHDDFVIAPSWAARHVFPNAFVYGSLGFLLGLGLRYVYRRYTATSSRDVGSSA